MHQDVQLAGMKAHRPMHVTGEVAEFQRRCCVGWDELQHLLFAHHNHDCAILLEKQNGAIVQPLVARQGDGAFGAGIGLHPQAMPSSILSAENDALDAVLIAACAAAVDPPEIAPDPRLTELADYLTFLEQIEEDIRRFKTRLEHIDEPTLRRIVNSDIARLKARKTAQMRDIAKRLRSHDDLAKRLKLVLSIPGIGERTALAIVIRMPELGRVSREEAAALAGLAPFDADSGQHRGQRKIAGGRSRLRRSLFAAALPAAFRWNKALIALYARLMAKGKVHNAALIACARKLLIYANTVVQRGTPWTEKAP